MLGLPRQLPDGYQEIASRTNRSRPTNFFCVTAYHQRPALGSDERPHARLLRFQPKPALTLLGGRHAVEGDRMSGRWLQAHQPASTTR